jgi:hypothetical protein
LRLKYLRRGGGGRHGESGESGESNHEESHFGSRMKSAEGEQTVPAYTYPPLAGLANRKTALRRPLKFLCVTVSSNPMK